nr:SH3 domain-containing protein [Mammaliicoccus sp. Marseille-Q6498]
MEQVGKQLPNVRMHMMLGGYATYDEVCLRDSLVWICYNWEGIRYYLPVCTWDGVSPPYQSVGGVMGRNKLK